MKKKIILITVLSIFSAGISLTSFRSDDLLPADIIKSRYVKDLSELKRSVDRFHNILRESDNPKSAEKLKEQFLQCRNIYKKAEFLAVYLDAEFVKDFINGAPLPRLERNAPSMSVLEPEGLQIMDELLFSAAFIKNKPELIQKTANLQLHINEFIRFQKVRSISNAQIFEAARYELIRIFTLGITGFDTPASGNALPEAIVALKQLQETLKAYYPLIDQKDSGLSSSVDERLNSAIEFIVQNNEFDSFDRLTFVREHLNPLYGLLQDIQEMLGIETPDKIRFFKQPVNYAAKNVFANNFLDAEYYIVPRTKEYDEHLLKLGKTLFFDPVLSANNQRSCASCHNPTKGFADGQPKSLAFDLKGTVSRNAPTLINSVYSDRYFYDLRSGELESQIEHVIFSEKEFHTDYFEIFDKLKQSGEYVEMFRKAFPDFKEKRIFKHTLSVALASYVKSLSGFNSDFDKYVRGESDKLSEPAKRGFNLFMGKAACGTCHFAPVFSGSVPPLYMESESEVLGVPATTDTLDPVLDEDKGRIASGVIKEAAPFYERSFKTVTVRNVALTAPYMHNGVFNTLEEVLDFYNKGGGQGLGLEVPHQTLPPDRLNLTQQEMKNIIAFMESLTDTAGMTSVPARLPSFPEKMSLNDRKVGGMY